MISSKNWILWRRKQYTLYLHVYYYTKIRDRLNESHKEFKSNWATVNQYVIKICSRSITLHWYQYIDIVFVHVWIKFYCCIPYVSNVYCIYMYILYTYRIYRVRVSVDTTPLFIYKNKLCIKIQKKKNISISIKCLKKK